MDYLAKLSFSGLCEQERYYGDRVRMRLKIWLSYFRVIVIIYKCFCETNF